VLAPAGTPRPIVERLSRILSDAVASEDVRARIASEGGDPLSGSPEDYAADIERDGGKWAALIAKLGLKVD